MGHAEMGAQFTDGLVFVDPAGDNLPFSRWQVLQGFLQDLIPFGLDSCFSRAGRIISHRIWSVHWPPLSMLWP